MSGDEVGMSVAHSLLRAYRRAPDHMGKLRVYDWLRSMRPIRHMTLRAQWGIVRLDLLDYLQHEMFIHTCYEPLTFNLFKSLLRPGAKVIDVGANIGQYALSAGHLVGPAGKVIAIEPNPLICQKLIDNRRLNSLQGRVEIVSSAVASAGKLLDFGIPRRENLGAMRQRQDPTQECFWTTSVSLARLISEFGFDDIEVVKVDIEGADLDVIRDLMENSSRRPKNIIFEYIPQSFKYSIEDQNLVDYFAEFGYTLRLVTGEKFCQGCDIAEFNLWAEADACPVDEWG